MEHEGFETIVDPRAAWNWRQEHDTVFVDCRFSLADESAGHRVYKESHIAEARYADLNRDLSGDIIPGATGRHPIPTLTKFVGFLESAGISNDTQVFTYDDSGGAFAARLWWLLKYVGHKRVAVIDGGWNHWLREGLPVNNGVVNVERTEYTPQVDGTMLVSSEDVVRAVAEGIQLIDARSRERYLGEDEPIDPIAGHIPGAASFPFKENLNPDGSFKAVGDLRTRFEEIGGKVDIISYCGSGVTAAHNALALVAAGYEMPKLYVGSWSEWITDESRAIATGED